MDGEEMLKRQIAEKVRDRVVAAVAIIDAVFWPGFARQHPELIYPVIHAVAVIGGPAIAAMISEPRSNGWEAEKAITLPPSLGGSPTQTRQ